MRVVMKVNPTESITKEEALLRHTSLYFGMVEKLGGKKYTLVRYPSGLYTAVCIADFTAVDMRRYGLAELFKTWEDTYDFVAFDTPKKLREWTHQPC